MSIATIYDVAQKANVSIATVSRVINSPQRVNELTRQRVLAVIDELGYVPKAEASARARQQNQRIGVLAPFFFYPSFVQRVRGIASVLDGTSYEMIVYNADTEAHCRSYLESLPIAQRLDGLIVISLLIDNSVVQRFDAYSLPVVMIETSHTSLCCVEVNNEMGGRLAARYLLDKGHTHFAFIGGDIEIPSFTMRTSEVRLLGFQRELAHAGMMLAANAIRWTEHDMEKAELTAYKLFEDVSFPVAIMAGNDTLAFGILKAAYKRGLRVPEDVAVIGFDNLDMADYVGLTTVDQMLEQSGQMAVELLLTHMNNDDRPVNHISLPQKVIARATA